MSQKLESANPATGDLVGVHVVDERSDVDAAVARARRPRAGGPSRASPAGGGCSTSGAACSPGGWPSSPTSCTRRPASRTRTRCSRSGWRWTTWRGPRPTPRGARGAQGLLGPADGQPGGVGGVPPARRGRGDRPVELPVFTPMGSIGYALAAGNTVVFKPSELTPGVGVWLADAWPRWCPTTRCSRWWSVGETGPRCAARASTSSRSPAPPRPAEGDGRLRRDPDPGAHRGRRQGRPPRRRGRRRRGRGRRRRVGRPVQRRADLHRGGAGLRARAGVRRVPRPADPPRPRGARRGRRERPDRADDVACAQVDVVRRHVEDAGVPRRTCGGRRPRAAGDQFVQPTVLTDVPQDSVAITEETFGPTVTVNKVRGHGRGGDPGQRHPLGSGRRCSRGPAARASAGCGRG